VGVGILVTETWRAITGPGAFLKRNEDPTATGVRLMGPARVDPEALLAKPTMPPDIREAFERLDEWRVQEAFLERINEYDQGLVDSIVPRRRKRRLLCGALLVIAGFLLQIAGAWPV
jgi:hypothetical protein